MNNLQSCYIRDIPLNMSSDFTLNPIFNRLLIKEGGLCRAVRNSSIQLSVIPGSNDYEALAPLIPGVITENIEKYSNSYNLLLHQIKHHTLRNECIHGYLLSYENDKKQHIGLFQFTYPDRVSKSIMIFCTNYLTDFDNIACSPSNSSGILRFI